ncbi:MAG TPA: DUF6531 domain-containing protein [Patescibacteria group bacterium]
MILRAISRLVVSPRLVLTSILSLTLLLMTSALGWHFFYTSSLNPFSPGPQAVYLEPVHELTAIGRQKVSADQGGTFAVNKLQLALPAGFTDQDVVVSYRRVDSPKLVANYQVGSMFDLKARTEAGEPVTQFDQPLTLTLDLSQVPRHLLDIDQLGIYFFDEEAHQWQPLDSHFDEGTGQLIAQTTHFTVFMAAAGDPNEGVTQTVSDPLIIDDQDPTGFVFDGQTDSDQPEFEDNVGSGYNGDATYTGNSINNTPHNWGIWTVESGLTGEVELFATIPNLIDKPMTTGATYQVTHANGTTNVVINQEANRGGVVSLGTFTFNGSGSVKLDDVVPEQGSNFASHIVFDAISFGVPLDPNLDLTPPLIEDVKVHPDNGTLRISAKVTDTGSGVDTVYFVLDGLAYPMSGEGDYYSIDLEYQKNANLDYYIVAYDVAGNEGIWSPQFGYMTRGAFYRLTGYYPGMIWDPNSACFTNASCDTSKTTRSQIVGHPINTANGNLIEEVELLKIGGRPEINLTLTYNNQSGRPSIFGENWTHSYNYHALAMETPDFEGVFIQYPDGKVVTFSGPDLEPEPGYFETLERDGDGFILTFPDLTQITFNADGDVTRWEDANDNGLNFAYGAVTPYTLMSQLTNITADGGRSISFTYNDDGLVENVSAPEGKTLSFTYSDDNDLASWTDGRGGITSYTYDDHNLVTAVTPEGFTLMTNQYDGERRVVDHQVGEAFHQTLAYSDEQTVVTDAHGYATTYSLDDDDLITRITNDAGDFVDYEFTDQKQIASMTDEEGETWEYEYDERGNRVLERDPLGFEITRTFDTTFNKPLTEVNKIADHITTWTYDSRGNLLTETHAEGATRTLTYDSFGQLITESDFNGQVTTYSYNAAGDRESMIDALSQTTTYAYDGLGRLTSVTNPRAFTYDYTYDQNDNLVAVDGPLGYHLGYVYDKNDRLIEEIDANGGSITYSYDNSDNLKEKQNQLDFPTTYAYGPMNELLEMVSPEGHVTQYAYNSVYDLVTMTEAVGTDDERQTAYTYNGRHELTEVTDAEGRVTKLTYDPLGRMTKEVQNAVFGLSTVDQNVTTEYEYNATGALTKVIDPNDNLTIYEHDKLDRVVKVTDAENQISHFEYDGQSNLTKLINPRTFSTTYEFDPLNRLATVIDAKNGETKYEYDPNSNLSAVTDANGITTAYTYDALDRREQKIAGAVPGQPSDAQTNVTTHYAYDLHGNLTAVTNPRGFQTQFVYDPAHRNTQIIDALAQATEFTYDQEDNLIQLTDRNDHSRQYQYDALNRLVTFINPENHQEKYQYDKVDNQVQFTNLRNLTYSHEYDPLNRLVKTTNPLNGTKHFAYDAVGNLLELTDENNHTDQFEYDRVYRLIASTDAEDNTTTFTYDANGNRVQITDAENNPTAFVYDELDRLIEQTNAENETEKYAYDATVNLTQKTEADGTPHTYQYDPLYRLAMVVNNARGGDQTHDTNVATRYAYDPNGNLTVTTDANTHQTKFEYDPLDRLIAEVNPLNNTWHYEYDHEQNLVKRIDANGVETKYSYYPDDVLALIDYPEQDVEYQYNETNFPVQMDDHLGTTTWSYDELDRLTEQHDPLGRTLSYEYDPVGNLTKLQYPDGRSMAHEYLKNDWLKISQSSDQDKVKYTRNKVGVPTIVDRSNQTKSSINYDKVYRPLEVADIQLSNKQPTITKFQYTYNDIGHQTQEIATYGWRQPKTVTTNFTYDGIHRLAESTADDGNRSQYLYDAVGNRTQMVEHLTQGPETRQYSYNSANQLLEVNVESPQPPNRVTTAYSYDNNGNRVDKLIKDETGIERGVAYAYDTENRLLEAQDYQFQLSEVTSADPEPTEECVPGNGKNNGKDKSDDCNNGAGNDEELVATDSAEINTASGSAQPQLNELSRTELAYDGNGRRLVSTYYSGSSDAGKKTEFTFDRLDPVAEYNIHNGQRQNLYRTSAQDLIAYQEFKSEQDPNGSLYWYHYDGEGNISATSKHSGQSDHAYRYDEYGTILSDNGTPNHNGGGASGWNSTPGGEPHNSYTLTQKRLDPHTGLYYFGARHYDPEVGVWLTQDTYRGQVPNPQSMHRYMYNYSSPMNYVDLYGYKASFSYNANENKVYVTATIEIYGDESFDLERIAERWEMGIENTWNGHQYQGRDVVYIVDVIVGTEECKVGDNCIRVMGPNDNQICSEAGRSCMSGINILTGQMSKGEWSNTASGNVAAHEFGHICGLGDDYVDKKDANGKVTSVPKKGHEPGILNEHLMAGGANVAQHEVNDMIPLNTKAQVLYQDTNNYISQKASQTIDWARNTTTQAISYTQHKMSQGWEWTTNAAQSTLNKVTFWD